MPAEIIPPQSRAKTAQRRSQRPADWIERHVTKLASFSLPPAGARALHRAMKKRKLEPSPRLTPAERAALNRVVAKRMPELEAILRKCLAHELVAMRPKKAGGGHRKR